MDTGRISIRYVKAIYEFALKKGEDARLYEEMKTLADSFFSFRSLRKVMEDPTISTEEKKKLLITAGGISVSSAFKSLVDLVAENKRELYIQSIALMYQEYYRKEKGFIICKLTTAQQSTSEVLDKIKGLIVKGSKKQVDFITQTDPSLIGGFVLEIENEQLDASIKSQLRDLKLQLMEANKNIV